MKQKRIPVLVLISLFLILYFFGETALRSLGSFIVAEEKLAPADAVLVLYSGIEYYPRLIQAAEIYKAGLASRIIINGNRKNEAIRAIEKKGYTFCCHWCEDYIRIMELYDVPRDRILCISAEDAYDTVSEAEAVGNELERLGLNRLIVTTSKYHSRRALHIWRKITNGRIAVQMAAAQLDPYDPNKWWKEGRQIRWVMAEYGAWLFYLWKQWPHGIDAKPAAAYVDMPENQPPNASKPDSTNARQTLKEAM